MLRAFEPWHLLVIGGIATVLFGAKRLPDSARSLGQSLRILKSEVGAAQSSTDQAGPAAQAVPTAQAGQADGAVQPALAVTPTPTTAASADNASAATAATPEKQTA